MELQIESDSNPPISSVVADIERAITSTHPADCVAAVLHCLAARDVPDWCHVADGIAEQLVHHEPYFTMYLLAGARGVRFAPHEHAMAVSTLVLRGEETNVWYRELHDGTVAQVGRSTSSQGELGYMEPDTIHAVEYPSDLRPLALHVYHGDLLSADRRMWNHDGSSPRPYNQHGYEQMTVDL